MDNKNDEQEESEHTHNHEFSDVSENDANETIQQINEALTQAAASIAKARELSQWARGARSTDIYTRAKDFVRAQMGGAGSLTLVCSPSPDFNNMLKMLPPDVAHDIMVYGETCAVLTLMFWLKCAEDSAGLSDVLTDDFLNNLFSGSEKEDNPQAN